MIRPCLAAGGNFLLFCFPSLFIMVKFVFPPTMGGGVSFPACILASGEKNRIYSRVKFKLLLKITVSSDRKRSKTLTES